MKLFDQQDLRPSFAPEMNANGKLGVPNYFDGDL